MCIIMYIMKFKHHILNISYPECLQNERIMKNSINRIALNELKNGNIKRTKCANCGSSESVMHHFDYSIPLDVIHLCVKCHSEIHLIIRNNMKCKNNVIHDKNFFYKSMAKIEEIMSLGKI